MPTIESTIEPIAELTAFINFNKIKKGISFSESNVVLLKAKENVERVHFVQMMVMSSLGQFSQ